MHHADYWKRTLTEAPTLLEVPADHPRPAQQNYDGASAELALDEQLTSGLKDLSKRREVTPETTLLAAWAVLLARLSGQRDLLIGLPAPHNKPTPNRVTAESENLNGLFANTLVVRLNLSNAPSVRELLGQGETQVLAARQNQDIPFEQVVEAVQPVRGGAHHPLVQVMFAWQTGELEYVTRPGLDLKLELRETGGTISVRLEYATALFEHATIQRYLEYFRNLLAAMVADDSQAVDRLPILSEAERHHLLYELNDTGTDFSSDKCTHQLFEEQAAKSPDAAAVVFEGASLSYAELNSRANQLAHYLQQLGVRPDERVAICVERSFEMAVALMAVLKAGGAYVPLDPSYPVERLRYMLQDSAPVALLTQCHLEGLFSGISDKLPVLDMTAAPSAWGDQPETNPDPAGIGLNEKNLAYVIYTSGSTGQPKGVMVEHRGLRNLILWYVSEFQLSAQDASLIPTSTSFDLTYKNIYAPLVVGGRIHVVRNLFDPRMVLAPIATGDIEFMNLTPTAFYSLIDASESNELSKVGRVLFGGEPMQPAKLLQVAKPRPEFVNTYGPTECTGITAFFRVPSEMENWTGRTVPIGRPLSNARVYILDAHGEPVPLGVSGELHIGGAGVSRGYRNRPDLTAEKFVPDPFVAEPGARMYRTGDLGRWLADGTIEFIGRNDFQVKIRGFRIELGEIESRLAEYPGVRQAVVVAREDAAGEKRLVGYYTSSQEGSSDQNSIDIEKLRLHLAGTLPDYMVPAAYVRLESLPLTPSGKLDRKALPAPGPEADSTDGFEAPESETEQKIAAIWQEALGVAKVGKNGNFFDLGGDSVRLMKVQSRLRQAFHKDIPMVDMFTFTTVRALADHLAGESDSTPTETVLVDVAMRRKAVQRQRQVRQQIANEVLERA